MSSAPIKSGPVTFGGVNPIFRVADVKRSIDHYVQVLGFKLLWESPFFASVARDKCQIFLSQGDQGHFGTWVWIGVEDCDAVLSEYTRSGAKIRHRPTNYPWAWEMQIEDLDGNVLRIGSDPKENEPTGEWLDMDGQRWLPADDGWKRAD